MLTWTQKKRIRIEKDDESISVFIDGLYAGYAELVNTKKKPCEWKLDTLLYGQTYLFPTQEQVLEQTFIDYEQLGTNQRIRASILKDSRPVDLHELLLSWLEEGFALDEKFNGLIRHGDGDVRSLLGELLNEWGKSYFSQLK